MAWSNPTSSRDNFVTYWSETSISLPSSATTAYSSAITFLKRDLCVERQYIHILAVASAVTGTNVDIGLYGSFTETGTKYLLADAIIADVTNSDKDKSAAFAIWQYPMPFYFIGHTTDTDESANTISYYISI